MIKKLILVTILINGNLCSSNHSQSLQPYQQLPADQRYVQLAEKVLDPQTAITSHLITDLKKAMQEDTLHELRQSVAPYWINSPGNMTDFYLTQCKKLLVTLLSRFHFDLEHMDGFQIRSDLTTMNRLRLYFYGAAQNEQRLHRAMYSAILKLGAHNKNKVLICATRNCFSPFEISKLYDKAKRIEDLKRHIPDNYLATQEYRSHKLDIKSAILSTWCQGLNYDAQNTQFIQESSTPFLASKFERLRYTLIDVHEK